MRVSMHRRSGLVIIIMSIHRLWWRCLLLLVMDGGHPLLLQLFLLFDVDQLSQLNLEFIDRVRMRYMESIRNSP